MSKTKVAIVGYGNIGRFSLEAVEAAGDMECVGVVRRSGSADGIPELSPYKVVSDISELGNFPGRNGQNCHVHLAEFADV